MPDFLRVPISFWWAVLIAVLCFTGEAFLAGEYFLWTGVSALIVAVAMNWMPGLPIFSDLVAWIVLSALAIYGARYYHKGQASFVEIAKAKPEELLGVVATLQGNSKSKLGTIRVKRAFWEVHLERDLAAGTAVRVSSVERGHLFAEALSKDGSEGA